MTTVMNAHQKSNIFKTKISSNNEMVQLNQLFDKMINTFKNKEPFQLNKMYEYVFFHFAPHFINIPIDDIQTGIELALKIIGMLLEVNADAIYLLDTNTTTANLEYQWLADNNTSTKFVQSINVDKVISRYNLKKNADVILWTASDNTQNLFSIDNNICLYGITPLYYEKRHLGFICFEFTNKEKYWNKEVSGILNLFSEIIVNLLMRKEKENTYINIQNNYMLLAENANDIIYKVNNKGRFIYANIVALLTIGGSNNGLIGMSYHRFVRKDYQELITNVYRKQMAEKTKDTYYEFPIVDKNGKEIWIGQNAQVIIEKDKVVGLQAIARDISQKRKNDANTRIKNQFEDIITHIATKFINLSAERMDEGINLTLQSTSIFTGVDRSYVFLYHDNGNFADNTHEWCANGITAQINNLQNVPLDMLPWWRKEIENQKVIYIPRVADMTEKQAAEKELLEAQDIMSLVVVPLVSNNKAIGFLGFDSVKKEKNWEEDFIDILKIVAEVIVNLIQRMEAENKIKSLYSAILDDIETASTIQSYLVPKWLILEENIGFSSTYSPSQSVGGDIFDIIKISEMQYFVYIGDISGHGVQAALLMTAVKSIIKMITENEKGNTSPSWIVNRLNKVLCKELFDENYMTLFFAYIDLETDKMTFYNAGHPPMIQYDCLTNQTRLIDSKGNVPIGWKKEIEYTEKEEGKITIDHNSVYLFYTDGIFECENKRTGKQLGIKGLQNFLEIEMEIENYLAFPQRVKQTLMDNGYDITTDDFTVLAFQRLFNSICYDNNIERQKGTCGRLRGFCPLENSDSDAKCLRCDVQQFTITSLLQNIQAIGTACENVVINFTDDEALAAKVELAVNEYLSNIIAHGLANKHDSTIYIEIRVKNNVKLLFLDKGIEYNIEIDCDSDKELFSEDDKYKSSGRGLEIIQTVASNFKRQRYADINETIIEFSIEI